MSKIKHVPTLQQAPFISKTDGIRRNSITFPAWPTNARMEHAPGNFLLNKKPKRIMKGFLFYSIAIFLSPGISLFVWTPLWIFFKWSVTNKWTVDSSRHLLIPNFGREVICLWIFLTTTTSRACWVVMERFYLASFLLLLVLLRCDSEAYLTVNHLIS